MEKSYEIFCDKCGKVITEVTIYPNGEDSENNRPTLKLSGLGWICSSGSYSFTKNSLLRIANLIEEKRFKEVAEMDYDLFGFFCCKCDKNYCLECWTNITQFFDGDFYDYTLATCPAGHRQEIND